MFFSSYQSKYYIYDSYIEIIDSHFTNNSANVGGVIAAYGETTSQNKLVHMHIVGSTFINNRARTYGGAIAAAPSSVVIENCIFEHNYLHSTNSFFPFGGLLKFYIFNYDKII